MFPQVHERWLLAYDRGQVSMRFDLCDGIIKFGIPKVIFIEDTLDLVKLLGAGSPLRLSA